MIKAVLLLSVFLFLPLRLVADQITIEGCNCSYGSEVEKNIICNCLVEGTARMTVVFSDDATPEYMESIIKEKVAELESRESFENIKDVKTYFKNKKFKADKKPKKTKK